MNKKFRSLFAAIAIVASSSAVSAEIYGSLTSPPGVYFGAGNPNGAFNIDREGGLELGLRAKNRSTVGPVLIDGSSGIYSVASGFCPSCGGAGTRAKWNYEFSIHTTDGSTLSDYVFMLGIDHDPSAGTNFTYVNPLNYWNDDAFDSNLGAQNSQNVAFGNTPGGAISPLANGLYDFVLFAYRTTDLENAVARVDMTVSVPEPGTIAMFGLGMASLLAFRRRKAKQS